MRRQQHSRATRGWRDRQNNNGLVQQCPYQDGFGADCVCFSASPQSMTEFSCDEASYSGWCGGRGNGLRRGETRIALVTCWTLVRTTIA
jgi:hypothetical protein